MTEDRGQYLPAIRDEAIMPATFDGMLRQAEVLFKSGLLPAEIKSPAAALAIILAGRELNIPPMQALRSIYVVKGKPALSAQLMGALIWRAGHSYHVDELTQELCRITFQRRGQKGYTHTFTIGDAKAAGLTDGASWQHYKKAMLFSRCMSAGARIQMSDVIAGMYTVEELADPDAVAVDDEGTVTVVAEEIPTHTSTQQVGETLERMIKQATEQVKPASTASNGKRPPSPEAMLKRIWELIEKAHLLSGGKRYNAFHLSGHLVKHYGKKMINELDQEQLIAFGKELRQEVRELENAAAGTAPKEDALPEDVPGEETFGTPGDPDIAKL